MAGTSKPTRSARRRASKVFNLQDFEDAARRHLPKPIFDYIAGASEDSSSFRRNRSDFEAIRFIPRVLAGKTDRDQSVTLFGKTYDRPFGIAPMGLSALAAFDGDVALVACANLGTEPESQVSGHVVQVDLHGVPSLSLVSCQRPN